MPPLVVLITGCNSGIGRLTALHLARRGHHVFAGMREKAGRHADAARSLLAEAAGAGGSLHVVEIDVSHEHSVNQAVAEVVAAAGHIDVAVNNAGIYFAYLTEATEMEDFERMFDVNVFGAQRVNRAVLPHLRRQGSGLLVHVSSGLGRFVLPFMGAYCASKFALEALAETYRYELAPLGIDSVIVEPGAFPTGIAGKTQPAGDVDRVAGYGPVFPYQQKISAGFDAMLSGPNAPDPLLVAEAIGRLIDGPRGQRPLRTVVDTAATQETVVAINAATETAQKALLTGMGLGSLQQLTRD